MPRSALQAKPEAAAPGATPRPWPMGWALRAAGLASRHEAGCWAALIAVVVLAAHAGKYPRFAGFFAGVDQQRYLRAAQAWAHLSLDPAQHHYLPFYPLMAAPFVWITPWQPFFLPDLLCLLGAYFAFLGVARRLGPAWRDGVLGLCFVLAVMLTKTLLGLWIVPWSSTGAAPFQMLSLLLALRFAERPRVGRAAALGAAIGAIAGFRPSDAAILAVTCVPFAAWAAARGGFGRAVRCCAAAAGGMALVVLLIGILHASVFGFAASPYMRESAGIGFAWRLLPLRWVLLAVTPLPMLGEGQGMLQRLPWILPGIAGMILGCATARGERRRAALLVAATVALHWAAYLCYRDMHPGGLWRFYNIHYFKWTFPFFMLWTAQLAWALRTRGQRVAGVAALLSATLLFCWKPVLRDPRTLPLPSAPDRLLLARTPRLDEALFLPLAPADWTAIYFARTQLRVGEKDYLTKRDTKLAPVAGGALLMTLRRIGDAPAVLILPPGLRFAGGGVPVLYRERLVLAWPRL